MLKTKQLPAKLLEAITSHKKLADLPECRKPEASSVIPTTTNKITPGAKLITTEALITTALEKMLTEQTYEKRSSKDRY